MSVIAIVRTQDSKPFEVLERCLREYLGNNAAEFHKNPIYPSLVDISMYGWGYEQFLEHSPRALLEKIGVPPDVICEVLDVTHTNIREYLNSVMRKYSFTDIRDVSVHEEELWIFIGVTYEPTRHRDNPDNRATGL